MCVFWWRTCKDLIILLLRILRRSWNWQLKIWRSTSWNCLPPNRINQPTLPSMMWIFISQLPQHNHRFNYCDRQKLKHSPHRTLVLCPLDAVDNRRPIPRILPLDQQLHQRSSIQMHRVVQIRRFRSYLGTKCFHSHPTKGQHLPVSRFRNTLTDWESWRAASPCRSSPRRWSSRSLQDCWAPRQCNFGMLSGRRDGSRRAVTLSGICWGCLCRTVRCPRRRRNIRLVNERFCVTKLALSCWNRQWSLESFQGLYLVCVWWGKGSGCSFKFQGT